MSLDLIAELAAVVDAFARESIEYALCGGLALAIHGHPRATMDIDVLVEAGTVPRALAVARSIGFDIPARKMIFGLRTSTPREVHRISKPDPETSELMTLDLLVVAPDLAEVWTGRVVVPWSGRDITIVSRAGLAIMKRIAGRPQDLADLAALEGKNDADT